MILIHRRGRQDCCYTLTAITNNMKTVKGEKKTSKDKLTTLMTIRDSTWHIN